jgi:hypothetical protein
MVKEDPRLGRFVIINKDANHAADFFMKRLVSQGNLFSKLPKKGFAAPHGNNKWQGLKSALLSLRADPVKFVLDWLAGKWRLILKWLRPA